MLIEIKVSEDDYRVFKWTADLAGYDISEMIEGLVGHFANQLRPTAEAYNYEMPKHNCVEIPMPRMQEEV